MINLNNLNTFNNNLKQKLIKVTFIDRIFNKLLIETVNIESFK